MIGNLLRQCGYLVRTGLPVLKPNPTPVGLTRTHLLCVPRFRVVCLYRNRVGRNLCINALTIKKNRLKGRSTSLDGRSSELTLKRSDAPASTSTTGRPVWDHRQPPAPEPQHSRRSHRPVHSAAPAKSPEAPDFPLASSNGRTSLGRERAVRVVERIRGF